MQRGPIRRVCGTRPRANWTQFDINHGPSWERDLSWRARFLHSAMTHGSHTYHNISVCVRVCVCVRRCVCARVKPGAMKHSGQGRPIPSTDQ